MTDTTNLLIILIAVVACALLIRALGRIVNWRLVVIALTIAILTSTGLLNLAPILTELDHLVTNLFGATT